MPPKITRVRWSASNLPWGISFNEQTGTFTGTPDKDDVGEYDIPITIETNFGKHQQYVKLNVLEKVEWEEVSLPNGCVIKNNTPVLKITGNNWSTSFLLFCKYTNTYNTEYYRVYRIVSMPSSFSQIGGDVSVNSSTGILANASAIYGACGTSTANDFYIAMYNYLQKIHRLNVTSGWKSITPTYTWKDWRACCYSSNKSAVFVFASTGTAVKVLSPGGSSPTAKNSYSTGLSDINKDCAAYRPSGSIMCITSANSKAAKSVDGETWETVTTPDNLTWLIYNSNSGNFLAYGQNSKLFYESSDGLSWTQCTYVPVPLTTVKSVTYHPSYGYCAIGKGSDGTEQHSAHSKDGQNWSLKKITNRNISLTNVIYVGGNINSFVASPASGGYLFQLKGSNV